MSELRWVIGITGASGALYGVRLLQAMADSGARADVVVSEHGWRLLAHEAGVEGPEDLRARAGGEDVLEILAGEDRGARPASGSVPYYGMVICPCSMGTVSAIRHGNSRSLMERAADVMLKERRTLILVPRETPLSTVHLENLLALSRLGVHVLPATPGFYHRPQRVEDLIDFVVARVLDHMHVEHTIGHRWLGSEKE